MKTQSKVLYKQELKKTYRYILDTLRPAFAVPALMLSLGVAAQDGGVIGRVTDPDNNKLQGAVVMIETLGRRVVTDAEGRFRLQGLPDGTYQVTVDYLGFEPIEGSVTIAGGDAVSQDFRFGEDTVELEVIEVVGSRAAIMSALNQERASDTLKTIIASSDAGKFADQNIAEALQRLPGISIERSDGEGRFVSVRGLGPNFTNVKLNGARVPSTETAPDRDRAVALDIIPSELLENLEVSKVVTAADDGDTIGGTVSIRSLSAFQRDGQYVSYKAELGYDERAEEDAYKASLIYSNLFADNTFGIAISLTAQDRDYLIENIEGDEGDGILDLDGTETLGRLDLRTLDLGRERRSANINLDYRPTDSARYFARFTHSYLLETEFRNRVSNQFRDDPELSGTNRGRGDNLRVRKEFRDQDEEQEIQTISIGGENFVGPWSFAYNASFSEATREEDDFRARFQNRRIDNVNFRFGTDSYLLEPATPADLADFNDRSDYEFDRFRITTEDSEDKNTEFTLDVHRDMDWGNLKFGAKYFKHEKVNDIENNEYEDAFNEAEDITLADFQAFTPDFSLGDWGPGARVPEVINFYQRQFAQGNVDATDDGDIRDNLIDGFVNDYDSEEEILAVYALGNFNIGENMVLNAGARVEQTDFSSAGFVVNTGDFSGALASPVRFDKDYTDVMPSANLRWNIRDDLVFRAGIFRSVVRPSFARNNPGIAVDFDELDNELNVQAGNPNLEPFSANNLDLNLAWYPEAVVAVLQAGIFYKDIDDFIFRATVDEDSRVGQEIINRSGDPRFATASDIDIRTSLNGESAKVTGLELSYYQELPAGFNIAANATFVDSEADLETRQVSLIGQADVTGNLTLGWADEKWDLRLSAAYTDDFLVRINDEENVNNDSYTNARTQVDFDLKYQLNDRVQIYFDALNLTEQEEFNEFRSSGSGFVQQYQNIERTFLIGVRGSFK
ncbi:TonB-dependent receptor [Exilibacterium tricleocarpae]|nr:TonB-dependent receptor [Exilibacterium tricleocarpae]